MALFQLLLWEDPQRHFQLMGIILCYFLHSGAVEGGVIASNELQQEEESEKEQKV